MPKVAIIYLCYNMKNYLNEVVSALEVLDYPREDLAVVFVTNASPDGIGNSIRSHVLSRSGKDFPRSVLLGEEANRGFAGGNNIGMQWAIDEGYDYVYLLNGDAKPEPTAIKEAVRVAEASQDYGAVQSLVLYWKQPDIINTSGGIVHVAGYGYARDNGTSTRERSFKEGELLAYASGAAVLYRSEVLKKVGLLEEGFFMYHEDLELGLRMILAGYKNVLAPTSRVLHDYQFSRNPKKFAWMELYRWIVMLAYERLLTILLLLPLQIVIEAGTWFMALKGGWIRAKFWTAREIFRPATWKLLLRMRVRAHRLRQVTDREWMRYVSGEIVGQETESFIVQRVANPVINGIWKVLYSLIRW